LLMVDMHGLGHGLLLQTLPVGMFLARLQTLQSTPPGKAEFKKLKWT
jgi:hypothetical protein